MENMQKQGEMHCDTEIVILIGTSEYIFKMLLENGTVIKSHRTDEVAFCVLEIISKSRQLL